MFDHRSVFEKYCKGSGLDLSLSFDMPPGYETAYGTFDVTKKTVFFNAKMLENAPDFEKAFYLFHELRHAAQYLRPESFDDTLVKSLAYVIMYDGTCYKLTGGEYRECRLDGGEEYFTDIYLSQPYEADANAFAYEQTKKLLGESEELRELYEFWLPKKPVPEETYKEIYARIDEAIDE